MLSPRLGDNMAVTYDSIASTTLTATSTNITFSSISGSYTDLRLVIVASGDSAGDAFRMQFNTDAGTNYSQTVLYGTGATASSTRATTQAFIELSLVGGLSTSVPHFYTMDLFGYAGSTFKTSLLTQSEDNNGSGYVSSASGMWRSTAAVTSIKVYGAGGNLTTGTTASLYGILKA